MTNNDLAGTILPFHFVKAGYHVFGTVPGTAFFGSRGSVERNLKVS
jgi:hypothetical protein